MSAIQIKNVPPELHERLRERARRQGRNLSDYALEVLERDLAAPTTREWLQRLKQDEPVRGITSQDITGLIGEGRAARDEQNLGALPDRD
jgi:plasmid stability protein